jgi:hypothetical protein
MAAYGRLHNASPAAADGVYDSFQIFTQR